MPAWALYRALAHLRRSALHVTLYEGITAAPGPHLKCFGMLA